MAMAEKGEQRYNAVAYIQKERNLRKTEGLWYNGSIHMKSLY